RFCCNCSLLSCVFTACSSKWLILVQSEGEESLKTKIVLPVKLFTRADTEKTSESKVEAGKGECVLHMYSSEESTLVLMMHLPSYEKLVTPINGSSFLIVSVIIFGGACGFCLFRKNGRAGNEVPYQSESVVVHDVEITYWDEGWDDDWDDKNAVKSPGGAANGLTARRLGS
ncbi:hypothetical protein IGI04_002698, partial [Brassica rapa subsp. trilocularis]